MNKDYFVMVFDMTRVHASTGHTKDMVALYPRSATASEVAEMRADWKGQPCKDFELLDDDGIVYFAGRVHGPELESESILFALLDGFGMGFGCTVLKLEGKVV